MARLNLDAAERWGLDRAREWMRENSPELNGRRPAIMLHNDDELTTVMECAR